MKNKPLTSIIFTAYDLTQTLRQITQTSLESIMKYTDEEDYELIFIDTIPESGVNLRWFIGDAYGLGQREDRQWIKRYVSEVGDPGQYACYNIGAKLAKGDYLCFYQNDVFVNEGWLTGLKYYLETKRADWIIPDQWARDRAFMKESYGLTFDHPEALHGNRDAGMIMMTREAFDKVGGWEESIKTHYGEKVMYHRLTNAGFHGEVTRKVSMLHLQHAAGWERTILEKQAYEDDQTVSSLEGQRLVK